MRRRPIPFLLVAGLFLPACFGPPGGKVAPDSRTQECKVELSSALEAFKSERGFAYEVGPKDGDTLMNEGTIAKSYARDGVTVGLDFGLEAHEGKCTLVAYKMSRTEPGKTVTTGTQGTISLEHCGCVADDDPVPSTR